MSCCWLVMSMNRWLLIRSYWCGWHLPSKFIQCCCCLLLHWLSGGLLHLPQCTAVLYWTLQCLIGVLHDGQACGTCSCCFFGGAFGAARLNTAVVCYYIGYREAFCTSHSAQLYWIGLHTVWLVSHMMESHVGHVLAASLGLCLVQLA